jgi:hypothetical protein
MRCQQLYPPIGEGGGGGGISPLSPQHDCGIRFSSFRFCGVQEKRAILRIAANKIIYAFFIFLIFKI